MWDFLKDPLDAIADYVAEVWNRVVLFLVELFAETLPNFVWSILPESATEELQNLDLTPLTELGEAFTWFYPVWGIGAIYTVAWTTAGAIRLVRFIIGWIPTVEG